MFTHLTQDTEARLAQLTTDMQPQWGMLTAQHMVEHLVMAIDMSLGKAGEMRILTPAEKLPKYQAWLDNDQPMPQNFKAPFMPVDALPALHQPDLATAKQALSAALTQFYAYFAAHPDATFPHPIYGEVGFRLWERIHIKHFSHHFSQFGLF